MKLCVTKTYSHLRRLAGWCGLLLYVGALSPVGFAATAVLGEMDPDHHIQFQPNANGLRLVLHHEGNCSRHQHGAVARVLTAFAQPASNTDPDHVLQFSSANAITRAAQLSVPAVNQSEPGEICWVELDATVATRSFQFPLPPRPPPNLGGQRLALRSTVFLI
jgi:hypothetical protein